jgi:hemoglobin
MPVTRSFSGWPSRCEAHTTGMPSVFPEFRSALVGYLEWGYRLAVINSQLGAVVDPHAPMPMWGWGEVKGPYTGA